MLCFILSVLFHVFHFTPQITNRSMFEPTFSSLRMQKALLLCKHALYISRKGEVVSLLPDLAMTLKPKLALVLPQCSFHQSWSAHRHWAKKCYTQTFKPPPDELAHQHSTPHRDSNRVPTSGISTLAWSHGFASWLRTPKPVLLSLVLTNPYRWGCSQHSEWLLEPGG